MDDEGNIIIKLFDNVMEPYSHVHLNIELLNNYKLYFTATLGLSKLSKDGHLLMLKKNMETTN